VVLGAGLDTYAHRARPGVRVFEVDHPGSQEAKRARLSAAGIATPAGLTYVGVDLEREPALPALVERGFDPSRPALVGWLAVSMYLTGDAVEAVLAMAGGLAPGSELVFDHVLPPGARDADGETYAGIVMPEAAGRGEPWLTFLAPGEVPGLLEGHGLRLVEHVRQRDAVDPGLWRRTDALRPFDLMRLVRATVRR
jgi:methyltransferase (TIGR00027 family)